MGIGTYVFLDVCFFMFKLFMPSPYGREVRLLHWLRAAMTFGRPDGPQGQDAAQITKKEFRLYELSADSTSMTPALLGFALTYPILGVVSGFANGTGFLHAVCFPKGIWTSAYFFLAFCNSFAQDQILREVSRRWVQNDF